VTVQYTGATVVGFGFRARASVASLRSALKAACAATERATGHSPAITALATAADKASHPAIIELAQGIALPLIAVPLAQLFGPATTALLPFSKHIPERYGARSLAGSSALAAAGPGAHLLGPRAISADRMATAAIAVVASINNQQHTTPP
jgi:cobalt-precorrin 5A hydrolase